MELVIDICDITYKDIVDNKIVFDEDNTEVATAIINGTPLPKGHGRIGDLDELEQRMSNFIEHTTIVADEYTVAKLIINGIRETPTIIKAESEEVSNGNC